MSRGFALGTALACAVAAAPAQAGPVADVSATKPTLELAAGLADPIDGHSARAYAVMWLSAGRHPWEVGAGFFTGRGIDRPPFTADRGYLAVARRFTAGRWYLGSGIAWVTDDDEVLSGRFQFQTAFGVSIDAWSFSLRHLSNGGTRGRNRGETFVLVARRF